ncbi:MAG TPA: class I SAM-dependent methyltransferase [Gemmatimonadaceae bacterium]|nr:class I SAM-dependent methyltransferase [Gemmatimonadaceae bacterium]
MTAVAVNSTFGVYPPVKPRTRAKGGCRFCGTRFQHRVLDLGMSPLCESFLRPDQINQMEPFYPLMLWVCDKCFLVQLEEYVGGEDIFTDYAYFSSFSDSWLEHCRRYVEQMISRLELNANSSVIELASNDGYLLQFFVERGIPVLGVEPAANVAAAAVKKGVPTLVKFFGRQTARELVANGHCPDLILGNNVLAQVPDLNDFVGGIKILLAPGGTVTIEFPHLMRTMDGNQFDQVYHEHFSYFSLYSAERIFAAHGLAIYDVEELTTHGGSLRIYAHHSDDTSNSVTQRLRDLRAREIAAGVNTLDYYAKFEARVHETKRKLLEFLIEAKSEGKSVVGYGAPGKGNTLLNYCGIRTDFVNFTVDRSPHKHGKFLPGTHIPIFSPDALWQAKPDYVLILPWNLKDEIMKQLSGIREWGGKFVVPIPELSVSS